MIRRDPAEERARWHRAFLRWRLRHIARRVLTSSIVAAALGLCAVLVIGVLMFAPSPAVGSLPAAAWTSP